MINSNEQKALNGDSDKAVSREEAAKAIVDFVAGAMKDAVESGQRWDFNVQALDFEWAESFGKEQETFLAGIMTGLVMQIVIQPKIEHLDSKFKCLPLIQPKGD